MVLILTPTGNPAVMVMITVLEATGVPGAQEAFEVSRQEILSLSAGVKEKVAPPVPALIPLIFHWYNGPGPGLKGVAVKVTEVPGQTGFWLAAIFTLTGLAELTDMMMGDEVAGLPKAQDALEVRVHATLSPFSGT